MLLASLLNECIVTAPATSNSACAPRFCTLQGPVGAGWYSHCEYRRAIDLDRLRKFAMPAMPAQKLNDSLPHSAGKVALPSFARRPAPSSPWQREHFCL
jgi:hypothetical protein